MSWSGVSFSTSTPLRFNSVPRQLCFCHLVSLGNLKDDDSHPVITGQRHSDTSVCFTLAGLQGFGWCNESWLTRGNTARRVGTGWHARFMFKRATYSSVASNCTCNSCITDERPFHILGNPLSCECIYMQLQKVVIYGWARRCGDEGGVTGFFKNLQMQGTAEISLQPHQSTSAVTRKWNMGRKKCNCVIEKNVTTAILAALTQF